MTLVLWGIHWVFHTSKKSDILKKNIAFSDINYEKISKSYNFNDVQCSKDTIHMNEFETSDILLQSNVHKSKSHPGEKDKESGHPSLHESSSSTNLNESESSKGKSEKSDLSFPDITKSSDQNQICDASNESCNISTKTKVDSCVEEENAVAVIGKAGTKPPNKICESSNKKEFSVKKSQSSDIRKRKDAKENEIANNICKEKISSESSETCDVKEDKSSSEHDVCQQKNDVKSDKNIDILDETKCATEDVSCKDSDIVNVSNKESQKSLDTKKDLHHTVPANKLAEFCSSNTIASEIICDSSKSVSSNKFEGESLKEHVKSPISSKSTSVFKSSKNDKNAISENISEADDEAALHTEQCNKLEKQDTCSDQYTKYNESRNTKRNKSTDKTELASKEQPETNSTDVDMNEKCLNLDSMKLKASKISKSDTVDTENMHKMDIEKCDDLKVNETKAKYDDLKVSETKTEEKSDILEERDNKIVKISHAVKEGKDEKGKTNDDDKVKESEDGKGKTHDDLKVKEGEDGKGKTLDDSKVKEGEDGKGNTHDDSKVKEGENEKGKRHDDSKVKEGEDEKGNTHDDTKVKVGEDKKGKTHDDSKVKVGEDKKGKTHDDSKVKEGKDEKGKTHDDSKVKEGEDEKGKAHDDSKVKEDKMEKKSNDLKEEDGKRKINCAKEIEDKAEKKPHDSRESEDEKSKTHGDSNVTEDKVEEKSDNLKENEEKSDNLKENEEKSDNLKENEKSDNLKENEKKTCKSHDGSKVVELEKEPDGSKDIELEKESDGSREVELEKESDCSREVELEKESDGLKESVNIKIKKSNSLKISEDKIEKEFDGSNESEDEKLKSHDDSKEIKIKLEKKSNHSKKSTGKKGKKCHSSKKRVDEKGKTDDGCKQNDKIDEKCVSEGSENKLECGISKENDLNEHQDSGKEKIDLDQDDDIEIIKVTDVKSNIKSRKCKKQKPHARVGKNREFSSNDINIIDSNEDLDSQEKLTVNNEKCTIDKIDPSDDIGNDSKDNKFTSRKGNRKCSKYETQEKSEECSKAERNDNEKYASPNDKIEVSSNEAAEDISENLDPLKKTADLGDDTKTVEPEAKSNVLSDKLDDGHQVSTDTKTSSESKISPKTSAKSKRKSRKGRNSRSKVSDLKCKPQSDANIKEPCDVSISDKVVCSKSVLNSENAIVQDHFKFYNLRHSLCIETKSKHPMCDLYVRKLPEDPQKNLITDLTFDISDDEPLIIYSNVAKMMKAQQNVKRSRSAKNKKTQPVTPKVIPPAPSPKKTPTAKKRGARNRKKESEKDDFISEGFLEIIGNAEKEASEKEARGKRKKGSEKDQASHQSSESESNQRKRSRRIQEQHQKKMSELAVEMEKEQRILEQMAKRSNANKKNTPQKPPLKTQQKTPNTTPNKVAAKSPNVKGNPNATKTPNKGSKLKSGKLEIPLLEEDTLMDSKRTTRKMNSRAKHLTKMTLMYEDESKDSQFSTSRETEKSKRRRKKHGRGKKSYKPWDLSSESSSSVEEITEEEEEDPEEPLIFEINEDEFACEEVDPDAQPVVIRRARTAKKSEAEGTTEEVLTDDKPCKKCGKHDKPEWILLCDKCDSGYHTHCLIPPLMIVPDGDWFCQPCEHMFLCQCLQDELIKLEGILKQREREALRKQRLAYVGISLDNVLKPDKKEEKSEESSKEETEKEEEKEEVKPPKPKEERHSDDECHTKLYGKRSVRARRNVNYRFKEYDELIASAIQEDVIEGKLPVEDFKEEGDEENGSRAGSDKPFTARVPKRKRRARSFRDLDDFTDEDDSGDEYQGGSSDSEATMPPSANSEPESNPSDAEWGVTKSKSKSRSRRATKPKGRRRRRRGRGGSSYEEDEEEDWEGEGDNFRPITRRTTTQKAISYREISSEEEDEWSAKPQQERSIKRKKNSSSESEASFKKKAHKKKRIHKWASSDSEESEEKSMTSSEEESEEAEEEKSGEDSESEFKIKQKDKLRLKSSSKKVLSTDEEEDEKESSTHKVVTNKKKKKKSLKRKKRVNLMKSLKRKISSKRIFLVKRKLILQKLLPQIETKMINLNLLLKPKEFSLKRLKMLLRKKLFPVLKV